ncbi:ribose 5-phosphate isomerase A [uncultured bacterium]|nr:ribose 5-phosphate isomerase A [uncultured bacterium]
MNDKELVAVYAAQLVNSGMIIGLGTGSTANYFIEALAKRYREENLQLKVVASSIPSTIKAQTLGLPLIAIEHIKRLDLYVDGADEVAPDLTLLKGRGMDLVREKILAEASHQFFVLVDNSKFVSRIGERFAIPIEVMPFAWQAVKHRLETMGITGDLRKTPDGAVIVTAHGSLVLDMVFDDQLDGRALNVLLNSTAGIVEHGVFYKLASAIFYAENGQVQQQWATH